VTTESSHLQLTGRHIVSGGAVLAVVALGQRLSSLLMLPVLARALDPSEFGKVALLLAVGSVAVGLFSFGAEGAVIRAVYLREPLERAAYFRRVLGLYWIAPVALALIAVVATVGRAEFVNGGTLRRSILIELVASALLVAGMAVPYSVVRAKGRYGAFAFLAIVHTGVLVLLRILFILILDLGVIGWAWSDLGAAAIAAALGPAVIRGDLALKGGEAERAISSTLKYGLPLLPHQLAHWSLNLSDRLVLQSHVTLAVLGFYSLGYQLAAVVGVLGAELSRILLPEYRRVPIDQPQRERLSQIASMQVLVVALFGAGMVLLGPVAISVVFPAEYADAAATVPMVALGFVFYGWYLIPMACISIMAGETRTIWVASCVAAAVNILSNLIFAPTYGAAAAAANTALAYLVLLVLVALFMQRRGLNKLNLLYGNLLRRLAFGTAVLFAAGPLPTSGVVGITGRLLVALALVPLIVGWQRLALIWRSLQGRSESP